MITITLALAVVVGVFLLITIITQGYAHDKNPTISRLSDLKYRRCYEQIDGEWDRDPMEDYIEI